ncbi:MAG: PaaI family thioesterase [Chloroflexi bacterium]|nr:PaaI family thioesterase [Chloroflexota bacterium]
MDFEQTKNLVDIQPYYRLLGMTLAELRPGYARLELPAERKLRQMSGNVHGGAICSALDSVGGISVYSLLDQPMKIVTIEMSVNFIAAISNGLVQCEGHIVHKGRTTAVSRVEAKSGDGRLMAIGLCTYMVLDEPILAGNEEQPE